MTTSTLVAVVIKEVNLRASHGLDYKKALLFQAGLNMIGNQFKEFRKRFNLSKPQVSKLLNLRKAKVANSELELKKVISSALKAQFLVQRGNLKELKTAASWAYSDAAPEAIITRTAGPLAIGRITGPFGSTVSGEKK